MPQIAKLLPLTVYSAGLWPSNNLHSQFTYCSSQLSIKQQWKTLKNWASRSCSTTQINNVIMSLHSILSILYVTTPNASYIADNKQQKGYFLIHDIVSIVQPSHSSSLHTYLVVIAVHLKAQVLLRAALISWQSLAPNWKIRFRKDSRLPEQLQRAMAAEAEAAREARAKIIRAAGEEKATRALRQAADELASSPSAIQLRYLQVRLNN